MMKCNRFAYRMVAGILGIFFYAAISWASDSIVGWTSSETVISDGTTTLSSGTILPIYSAPGIGKYIIVDGKRYTEAGNNRFVHLSGASPTAPKGSGGDQPSHRSHGHHHHHHKKTPSPEEWEKLDAERNEAMTSSQKIYRDLKKRMYPDPYQK